jgi:hypothetical protein
LAAVCEGLAELARAYPGTDFVYPVHLNPSVQAAVRGPLGNLPNVHLLDPVDYPAAIWLLRRCLFVITDSGGLQEEAPEFGKPVLVTRESTERSEGIEAGCAELVGHDRELLVAAARRFLDEPAAARLTVRKPVRRRPGGAPLRRGAARAAGAAGRAGAAVGAVRLKELRAGGGRVGDVLKMRRGSKDERRTVGAVDRGGLAFMLVALGMFPAIRGWNALGGVTARSA